ncbi:glycerophosphoryl diester phosphodiesterase membrane domain-containing protein [Streptomyces sp. NPDC005438]|uniref:glycerophosphoryl diester phosphodiesterase membrane domain-containing protein n=1 Tax=Streptomyces sp. NPDC005438 TaxID=3156880 RepID=UPI0033BEDE2A
MNNSPGWVPPGSSPSEPDPGSREAHTGDEERGTSAEGPQGTGNWSAQQPPAAPQGWGAAPPPGGHPPGAGHWGAPGSGAWHQPPAAKPGTVPLRPLGLGEILDGAVATMRTYWRPVLGISLGVAVVMETIATLANGILLDGTGGLNFSQDSSTTAAEASGDWISLFAYFLGGVIVTAMLTIVVSRGVLGRPVSAKETWRDSRPWLLRMTGLSLLLLLITVGAVVVGFLPGLMVLAMGAGTGAALLVLLGALVGMGVAVWLWVRFSLAAPALMLEKQGVTQAMRRSAKLVRNSWWRVFGIQLVTMILVFVVQGIVEVPFSVAASLVSGENVSGMFAQGHSHGWVFLTVQALGAVLGAAVTLPLRAGVTALVYLDLRIRREALDLELARAAGLSPEAEEGTPGATGS